MNSLVRSFLLGVGLSFSVVLFASSGEEDMSHPWSLGPFVRPEGANPVLEPRSSTDFFCPMRKQSVKWEEGDVFNPAAVATGE